MQVSDTDTDTNTFFSLKNMVVIYIIFKQRETILTSSEQDSIAFFSYIEDKILESINGIEKSGNAICVTQYWYMMMVLLKEYLWIEYEK